MDQLPGTLPDDPRLRGPLTVDDYYRLARDGVLPPKARVELIDGELSWMNAIGSPHASTVMRLTRLLFGVVQDRALVWVQSPLRLDRRNEPEPDLMLLAPRADFYRSAHPGASDVLLLIEVADSSLAFDRGRKQALYARHGVREYWVVDVDGEAVGVCRNPASGGYTSVIPVGPGSVLTIETLPGVSVPVDDVFG